MALTLAVTAEAVECHVRQFPVEWRKNDTEILQQQAERANRLGSVARIQHDPGLQHRNPRHRHRCRTVHRVPKAGAIGARWRRRRRLLTCRLPSGGQAIRTIADDFVFWTGILDRHARTHDQTTLAVQRDDPPKVRPRRGTAVPRLRAPAASRHLRRSDGRGAAQVRRAGRKRCSCGSSGSIGSDNSTIAVRRSRSAHQCHVVPPSVGRRLRPAACARCGHLQHRSPDRPRMVSRRCNSLIRLGEVSVHGVQHGISRYARHERPLERGHQPALRVGGEEPRHGPQIAFVCRLGHRPRLVGLLAGQPRHCVAASAVTVRAPQRDLAACWHDAVNQQRGSHGWVTLRLPARFVRARQQRRLSHQQRSTPSISSSWVTAAITGSPGYCSGVWRGQLSRWLIARFLLSARQPYHGSIRSRAIDGHAARLRRDRRACVPWERTYGAADAEKCNEPHTRACHQLSQTTLATSWTPARKFRAVFS